MSTHASTDRKGTTRRNVVWGMVHAQRAGAGLRLPHVDQLRRGQHHHGGGRDDDEHDQHQRHQHDVDHFGQPELLDHQLRLERLQHHGTGDAAQTRYGPVQVQLTVTDGKVTAVDVVEYPSSNGKDQQINARALPILVSETLSTQSSQIDMVSGATYTSDGYVTSLQSALDQAGMS